MSYRRQVCKKLASVSGLAPSESSALNPPASTVTSGGRTSEKPLLIKAPSCQGRCQLLMLVRSSLTVNYVARLIPKRSTYINKKKCLSYFVNVSAYSSVKKTYQDANTSENIV